MSSTGGRYQVSPCSFHSRSDPSQRQRAARTGSRWAPSGLKITRASVTALNGRGAAAGSARAGAVPRPRLVEAPALQLPGQVGLLDPALGVVVGVPVVPAVAQLASEPGDGVPQVEGDGQVPRLPDRLPGGVVG